MGVNIYTVTAVMLSTVVVLVTSETVVFESNDQNLDEFPVDAIPANVTYIVIHNSNIKQIVNVPAYPDLKGFVVGHNLLKKVPRLENICEQLHDLELRANRITVFDEEILDSMINLRYLALEDNKLTYFPVAENGPLNSLNYINLNGNKFTSFPSVSYITGLRELIIANNPISAVSEDDVKDMLNLHLLVLGGTLVHTMPDMCALLPSLNSLNINEIPLKCDIHTAWIKLHEGTTPFNIDRSEAPCGHGSFWTIPWDDIKMTELKWSDSRHYTVLDTSKDTSLALYFCWS